MEACTTESLVTGRIITKKTTDPCGVPHTVTETRKLVRDETGAGNRRVDRYLSRMGGEENDPTITYSSLLSSSTATKMQNPDVDPDDDVLRLRHSTSSLPLLPPPLSGNDVLPPPPPNPTPVALKKSVIPPLNQEQLAGMVHRTIAQKRSAEEEFGVAKKQQDLLKMTIWVFGGGLAAGVVGGLLLRWMGIASSSGGSVPSIWSMISRLFHSTIA